MGCLGVGFFPNRKRSCGTSCMHQYTSKPWLIQLRRLESQPGRRHSTARPQTNAPFCNFDNHDTACAMPLIESRVREGNATLAASFRLIEKATLVSLPRRIASAAPAVYAATLKSDFIETGVYAGGTSILLMKVLEQHNWPGNHWAADSFQGLPTGSDSDLEGCSNDARKSNGMFSCGVRGTRSSSSKSKFAGQFRASCEVSPRMCSKVVCATRSTVSSR